MKKIPIISFFSGPGGLDLGFTRAEYNVIAAYDFSKAAVLTYNKNLEPIATCSNLSEISTSDIINHIELISPDEKPVGVIGGPPCQYFSVSNIYKKENDPRRLLPIWYAKTLKELNSHFQLDFFLFENVAGMITQKHKDDFKLIKEKFDEAGFWIKDEIIDASNYSVPQIRKRLFILGISKRLNKEILNHFPPQPNDEDRLTVRNAISHLPEPVFTNATKKEIKTMYHPNHISMVPKSQKFHTKKFSSKGTRSFRKLDWDKPSWTVAYGNREMHVHPNCNRRVSVYEAMLLQGFPEDYELCGTFSDQVTQISNAVPPPLAFSIAQNIRSII